MLILILEFNGDFKHEHPQIIQDFLPEIEEFARVCIPHFPPLIIRCSLPDSLYTLRSWIPFMFFSPLPSNYPKTTSSISISTKSRARYVVLISTIIGHVAEIFGLSGSLALHEVY